MFCQATLLLSLLPNSVQDQLSADMYNFFSKEGDYARYYVMVRTFSTFCVCVSFLLARVCVCVSHCFDFSHYCLIPIGLISSMYSVYSY